MRSKRKVMRAGSKRRTRTRRKRGKRRTRTGSKRGKRGKRRTRKTGGADFAAVGVAGLLGEALGRTQRRSGAEDPRLRGWIQEEHTGSFSGTSREDRRAMKGDQLHAHHWCATEQSMARGGVGSAGNAALAQSGASSTSVNCQKIKKAVEEGHQPCWNNANKKKQWVMGPDSHSPGKPLPVGNHKNPFIHITAEHADAFVVKAPNRKPHPHQCASP